LKDAVLEHAGEEEAELFPKVLEEMSTAALLDLGVSIRALLEELAFKEGLLEGREAAARVSG
jgi:hypothetical protein